MFLGGNKEVDFDVNMLSTSLFYGDASRCIPLNLVAERVLWKWWALAAKDEISHRIALAYKDLMHEKEETRGYALQTILRYSVLSKDSHAHVLPVHRAFGGQPKPGGWEQLQLACEDHVYEAWNALIKEGAEFPLGKSAFFSFSAQGPHGYDYVFFVDNEDGPSLYVFIDATVSRLKNKLPPATSGDRSDLILGAIAKLMGLSEDRVRIKRVEGKKGQDEIIVLNDDDEERTDIRVLFVVATTQEAPQLNKDTVSWVRYVNLEKLAEAGCVQKMHVEGIGKAQS